MFGVVLAAGAAVAVTASMMEGGGEWAARAWAILPEKDLLKAASIVTIVSLVVAPPALL